MMMVKCAESCTRVESLVPPNPLLNPLLQPKFHHDHQSLSTATSSHRFTIFLRHHPPPTLHRHEQREIDIQGGREKGKR